MPHPCNQGPEKCHENQTIRLVDGTEFQDAVHYIHPVRGYSRPVGVILTGKYYVPYNCQICAHIAVLFQSVSNNDKPPIEPIGERCFSAFERELFI